MDDVLELKTESQSSFNKKFQQRSSIESFKKLDSITLVEEFHIDQQLPTTENKKKPPERLESIDPRIILRASSFTRDLDTPVTIDILAESGRLSKQSLDPVSRFSSRPTSVKETLFRKPSSKNLLENRSENMSSENKLDPIKEAKKEISKLNNQKSTLKKSKTQVPTLHTEAKKLTMRSQSIEKSVQPKKIETSRIEKNKKQKASDKKVPEPDLIVESVQTNLSTNSKSNLSPSSNKKLETNSSSRYNLSEKPSSAKSNISTVESKQPLISTMFEGLPQPYNNLVQQKTQKQKTLIRKPAYSANSSKPPVKTRTVLHKPKTATKSIKTKSFNSKSSASKILISVSNKNLEENLQKEIEKEFENEYEKIVYDEDDNDNISVGSLNSTLTRIKRTKSDSDLNSNLIQTSMSLSNSEHQLAQSKIDKGQSTTRINQDFIKSFEDRVNAIYTKFDNLLSQQEDKSDSKETDKKKIELKKQKSEFSKEMEKELRENIDFDEISSNPDLINRLKNLYNLVKNNAEAKKKDQVNNIKMVRSSYDNNNPNANNSQQIIRRNSLSIKSNADIRQVYSIVNTLSKSNNSAEITIKPSKPSKSYKIPASLSNKLNTLIFSIPKTSNNLDSIGNESNNSSISHDSNSISFHYDVKYRNDKSTSPINFQIDSENDFQFKWKRGVLLGKGAFGLVYQALLSTGEIIAVKQIEMEESDPARARKDYDNVREEVKILRELEHINIVQFMGTMLDDNIVNIFMELIPGGTIEALLKVFGPFDEDLFKIFTSQILEGVNYIHSRNVVHRDIKGKNIMLMSSGVIKLIDFGCAKRLKKNQSSNSIKQLLKSLKGTPYWMAPEVIRETGHGSKADIWSIGATVFEMATGLPPWGEMSALSAIYAIGSGETQPPELPDKFSPESRDFVKQCLIRDPEKRPSASDLSNHNFLK